MGDEQDAEPARLQVAEQVQHVDPGRGVEHADDLVGDEEPDVEQQRAGDQQALELPAAQLVRVLAEDLPGSSSTSSSEPRTLRRHSAPLRPRK